MSDYLKHLSEHRRITILRVLKDAPAFFANDSVLQEMAARVGVSSTRDQVRADMQWLRDVGLVTLETFQDVLVATITARGIDVALGLVMVEGVKRPTPR